MRCARRDSAFCRNGSPHQAVSARELVHALGGRVRCLEGRVGIREQTDFGTGQLPWRHRAVCSRKNTGPDTVICAVDADERHGASYQGLPIASKIRRKTGRISPALFDPGEKFDLIFVDADHDFDSVMNDSEVAFQLLAKPGVILWHDYNHEFFFTTCVACPRLSNVFAKRHAIYLDSRHLAGDSFKPEAAGQRLERKGALLAGQFGMRNRFAAKHHED